MGPDQLARECREHIALVGEGATITLVLPGKWGRSNRKRLLKDEGPWGTIVADDMRPGPRRVVVTFKAREVLDWIEANRERIVWPVA